MNETQQETRETIERLSLRVAQSEDLIRLLTKRIKKAENENDQTIMALDSLTIDNKRFTKDLDKITKSYDELKDTIDAYVEGNKAIVDGLTTLETKSKVDAATIKDVLKSISGIFSRLDSLESGAKNDDIPERVAKLEVACAKFKSKLDSVRGKKPNPKVGFHVKPRVGEPPVKWEDDGITMCDPPRDESKHEVIP